MNEFGLKACGPEEAQKLCHFIIFASPDLPKDLVLKEQTLRLESTSDADRRENNRTTFRQVFEGCERRLVIKQFLYDWAPPAYDYPCLWRNEKVATKAESPPPLGQFVNHNVLWIGKNYRNQNAATIEIERTRIEMTFEQGVFSKAETIAWCKSFQHADKEIAKRILKRPFSDLSYCRRFEEPAVNVPVGYWRHSRKEALHCFALLKEEVPLEVIRALYPLMTALDARKYTLSCGFGFGENKAQLEEIELIFEQQLAKGCFVRVLCTRKDSPFLISIPPLLSDQECSHKTLSINGKTFYYATSKNFAFGSHEIIFDKEPFHLMLLIKPAPWTNFEWVMELLTKY